jgi:FKBP-type peptidyl-prolyl cis-trans isomerase FkpA
MKKIILIVGIVSLFSSCLKTDTAKCTATDSPIVAPASEVANLQTYCNANAPAAIAHPSGIFYQVLTPGTGASANICSSVTVRYAGYIVGNSTPFENPASAISFSLTQVIVGWQKGLPLVAKGGSIRLYIPPSLAYGPNGAPPTIPPNAYLRFDIQVDDVK